METVAPKKAVTALVTFADHPTPVFIKHTNGEYLSWHPKGGAVENDDPVTTVPWTTADHIKWYIETVGGKPDGKKSTEKPKTKYYICPAASKEFALKGEDSKDNVLGVVVNKSEKHHDEPHCHVSFKLDCEARCWRIKFAGSKKVMSNRGCHAKSTLTTAAAITSVGGWNMIPAPLLQTPSNYNPATPENWLNSTYSFFLQNYNFTFLHLHNFNSGYCVNNQPITVWSYVNQLNLRWFLKTVPGQANSYFLCSAVDPDFVVHQYGGVQTDGSPISIWSKVDAGYLSHLWVEWERIGTTFGYYWLFKHSGKAIDIVNGATAEDSPLQQVTKGLTSSEWWFYS